ncbi:uncharacterized protein LOC143857033 [Tasmannia lanceolata]|uniref:uncharacterized protein LOC143857033 n=1 Tax=Tasmannia lanceolata TaxID=3420 RepID=UPI0040628465
MPNDTYSLIVDNELGLTVAEEDDEEEEDHFLTKAEDVRAGDIMESTSVEKRKKNNSWSDDMDRHLIVAIQHQIAEGQKDPNGFKEAAYSGTTHELTTIWLGSIAEKISVEDPVKNDYLARNPEHLHFFNNRWELYEEMKEVFGEDYATGEFARDRHAPSQDTQDVEGLFSSSQAVGLDDISHHSSPVRDTSMGFNDSSPLKAPASCSKGKRKRRTSGAQLSSNMTYLSDSVRMVAEAIITTGEVHSLAELKATVMGMPGFTMMELIRAYTYLYKSHKDAEVFLSLSEDEHMHMMRDIMARLA